jgi:hypothetical protein
VHVRLVATAASVLVAAVTSCRNPELDGGGLKDDGVASVDPEPTPTLPASPGDEPPPDSGDPKDNRSVAGGLKGSADVVPPEAPAHFKINGLYPSTADFQTTPPPAPDLDRIKTGDKDAARAWLTAMQAYIYDGMVSGTDVNQFFHFTPGDGSPVSKRWYHMPWLHTAGGTAASPGRGREGVWGLTRELDLKDANDRCLGQDWGLGFFNEPGGFAIGQLFPKGAPDMTKLSATGSLFPVGTVAFKVLFTSAKIPSNDGAMEITALVNGSGACGGAANGRRTLTTMRHIQMDVMMKVGPGLDDWLFGVFVYNPKKKDTFFQGMEPVGVEFDTTQTGTVVVAEGITPNGFKGRLNGPADNPMSSCLSCHARAQWPEVASRRLPFAPRNENDTVNVCILHDWGGEGPGLCRTCPAPARGQGRTSRCFPKGRSPIDPTGVSLDYSLQVALALRNRSIITGED